ncbi:MAG: FkbM family methyltransferase [Pseudomonadota bacterium]
MDLPFAVRWKLLRQDALAALRIAGERRVRLCEGDGRTIIHVDGQRIYAPSPLRWKLYRKGWTARLDRLAREYGVGAHATLDEQSVVIDIGANAGEFAHVTARSGARVYCCEPDPIARSCLERNVESLDGVSIHDVAIWKENGEINFGLAPDRADSSVFVESQRQISVRAQTLDSFMETHAIEKVDLIKCDAEGAEPEVLDGLNERAADVAVIALDTGAERKGERTHEPCAERLKAKGFRVVEEKIGTRWMTYGVR